MHEILYNIQHCCLLQQMFRNISVEIEPRPQKHVLSSTFSGPFIFQLIRFFLSISSHLYVLHFFSFPFFSFLFFSLPIPSHPIHLISSHLISSLLFSSLLFSSFLSPSPSLPLVNSKIKPPYLLRFGNNHGNLGLYSFKSTSIFSSVIQALSTSKTSIRQRASRADK